MLPPLFLGNLLTRVRSRIYRVVSRLVEFVSETTMSLSIRVSSAISMFPAVMFAMLLSHSRTRSLLVRWLNYSGWSLIRVEDLHKLRTQKSQMSTPKLPWEQQWP